MPSASVTVRIDENLKKHAEALFSDMGLNMTTAFNLFVKAVVRQNKIPFEIVASSPSETVKQRWNDAHAQFAASMLSAASDASFIKRTLECQEDFKHTDSEGLAYPKIRLRPFNHFCKPGFQCMFGCHEVKPQSFLLSPSSLNTSLLSGYRRLSSCTTRAFSKQYGGTRHSPPHGSRKVLHAPPDQTVPVHKLCVPVVRHRRRGVPHYFA